jgi:hypothetical protein
MFNSYAFLRLVDQDPAENSAQPIAKPSDQLKLFNELEPSGQAKNLMDENVGQLFPGPAPLWYDTEI